MSRSAYKPRRYEKQLFTPENLRIVQKQYRAKTRQAIRRFLQGKDEDIVLNKPMRAPMWLW